MLNSDFLPMAAGTDETEGATDDSTAVGGVFIGGIAVAEGLFGNEGGAGFGGGPLVTGVKLLPKKEIIVKLLLHSLSFPLFRLS